MNDETTSRFKKTIFFYNQKHLFPPKEKGFYLGFYELFIVRIMISIFYHKLELMLKLLSLDPSFLWCNFFFFFGLKESADYNQPYLGAINLNWSSIWPFVTILLCNMYSAKWYCSEFGKMIKLLKDDIH